MIHTVTDHAPASAVRPATAPSQRLPHHDRPRRAVVVGASIAGLLAAAALAEHYDEVQVLDRDALPSEPANRPGAPHGRHTHGLLSRGREAMEELLPGLTDDLLARGATLKDAQEVGAFHVGGRPLAPGSSGLLALGVSRPLLEWQIRRRVLDLPGVVVQDRIAVLRLVARTGGGTVTGVSVSRLDWPGTSVTVDADLVVDASGRTAQTAEWLRALGYDAPAEDRLRIDVRYATRTFRRPAASLAEGPGRGLGAVLQPSSPAVPRSAVLLPMEGDRCTVSIAGYHGVQPPTGLGEFVAYARTVPGPVADIVDGLEPLDDGLAYRFPVNVRRRYEHLDRFPEGLLVLGDAICAFDPAFGQGMSVAALEALELRGCLRGGQPDLARRYFRLAARHIDTPWSITVGRDRLLPGSAGPVPRAARLLSGYVDALLRAAVDDPALATAFLRVSHLAARPPSLLAPAVVLRVLRAGLRPGRRTRPGRPAPTERPGDPGLHGPLEVGTTAVEG